MNLSMTIQQQKAADFIQQAIIPQCHKGDAYNESSKTNVISFSDNIKLNIVLIKKILF